MYGQGGSFNPQYRHGAPPPLPPPQAQQQQGGVTGPFPQQPQLPPPPGAPYMQHPGMRPPPGPYQHSAPPPQNQAYPFAQHGQMHQMPMVPQQRGFAPMPGLPRGPPQAMYQPPQYPMPGSLPPPPPRPPSLSPANVLPPSGPPPPLPPPPPSSPPPLPPAPPAPVVMQSWDAEVDGKEGAPHRSHGNEAEQAATQLIVSDDSDMDMDGDEGSPSGQRPSPVNSSLVNAECIGGVNVPRSISDVSSPSNDLPPGSGENAKSANVTVEGGSPFRLIQGYDSDGSEDEVDTGAANNCVPKDNEHNHPSDRNAEIGHQRLNNAEGSVYAPPGTRQNGEAKKDHLKDESNPVRHNIDALEHLVREELSGSEFDGMQSSERHGRSQRKRSRSKSPQDTSCSPMGRNKCSPSQSSSPGRQSRSPLAKWVHAAGEGNVSEDSIAQQKSLAGTKKFGTSSNDSIGKRGDNGAPDSALGPGDNLTFESSRAASANAYDPHKMQTASPQSKSQSELRNLSSDGNQSLVRQSTAGVPLASVHATESSLACDRPQSHSQSSCPPEKMSSGFAPAHPPSSNMIQLPRQPLLASSELPQAQHQHNVVTPANEFVQDQMRSYPAPKLSHIRPLDFHHHMLQPPVPPHQQPPAIPVDNAPVPPPDRWSEYSGCVGLPYSCHQPPYGQQPPPGSLDSGTNFAYPSFQRFPSNLPGTGDLGPISDVGLPKSSIKPHYNPFASTFEQADPILNIDPTVSPKGVASASAKAEHMNKLSPFGQSFHGSGTHARESSAEVVPSVQKQFHGGFASGAPYDPLLDSIEPSSSSINKVDHGKEKNRSAGDSRGASKLINVEVDSENMNGLGVVAESQVEGLGEVAADTEAGVVENASPEFLGAKDWSSDIPGDIDNDQSLDKSKKSKDSRSMKLFKVAIADFVKEVLKPSWRQGNMSKEAFKTIVRKTVDKVSSSVPSSHIPKTPAKIKQYVQSSQRKVTKLVMGYVDKYAKL